MGRHPKQGNVFSSLPRCDYDRPGYSTDRKLASAPPPISFSAFLTKGMWVGSPKKLPGSNHDAAICSFGENG